MNCDIFLELNNVIAHLACWTDPETHSKSHKEIILFIPGNPGLIGFYTKYLEHLHKATNLPVWIIGHGGHEEPNNEDITDDNGVGSVRGREREFALCGQLQQKIDFLTDMIDQPTKIHLVGHSIGGWMAMELLKHPEISKKIVSVSLLYPTLEFIADTPNGFWVNKILRRITPILYFFLYIFSFLPRVIRSCLITAFFFLNNIPSEHLNTVLKYIRPTVIEKVLHLAFNEMDLVRNLDFENLNDNKNKINIVYTDKDGWAPGHRFKALQELIPDLLMEEVPYQHAFVLKNSIEVATITEKFISTKKEN